MVGESGSPGHRATEAQAMSGEEGTRVNRKEAQERVTEPVAAEDDMSGYAIVGTSDQYEELPFTDE